MHSKVLPFFLLSVSFFGPDRRRGTRRRRKGRGGEGGERFARKMPAKLQVHNFPICACGIPPLLSLFHSRLGTVRIHTAAVSQSG